MDGALKRLAASGLAYQAASLLAALLALFTLPLYTRFLSEADFGYAETILTLVILASILLRFGLGEAFVRYWHSAGGPEARRRLARTTTGFVLVGTTVALVAGILLAGPLSELVLGTRNPTLMACGVLGIWTFTNLEVAYSILRVDERRRAYLVASATNVLLTVALTVTLVVFLDEGARGYVLGNYAASGVVLVGLWLFVVREHLGLPRGGPALGGLLRFGAPTVPADAAVFLLNVIDRAWLLRAESPEAAGLYSVAIKLATAVIILVRGFQLAWPPLAYSITSARDARVLYARVTTAFVGAAALIVAGFTLLGPWVVRLLAAPAFFPAHTALPWLALGWALYGLYLVLVTIAGRAEVTVRTLPSAALGLAVNVGLLVLLVGPLGIDGAAIALCASYVAMLALLFVLTRRAFTVPFQWRRLVPIVGISGAVAVAGEMLLPAAGAAGLITRLLALLAIPPLLVAARAVSPQEIRGLVAAARSARSGQASA